MDKKNHMTSIIIVSGAIILSVFTYVMYLNLKPNYESKSYYVKVGKDMSAKIESISISNNKLNIETSGDAEKYCVKTTRSTPNSKNICWKEIKNDKASVSIYKNKKYYIWIKDANGNISNPMTINTKK